MFSDNFSFCKFQFPNNIRKIIWEITNQCNYSCEYCIFSSTGKKPRGELSFEQCIQTIEQLKQEGFNYIKFTGGEPFMRDDFLDILSYAQSQGFSFDISSNASFINDEISQKLSFLNINFIHISLDGYDSFSQEIVRGKKSFSKTVNGLQSLIKYNSNIRLGCVIHLYNQDKLQEIVNFANQYKIKEVIFSIMSPLGKMAKNSPLLTNKSVSQLIHTIESLHSEFTVINHNLLSDVQPITFNLSNSQSCPGGDKFLFIDSIGNVSPCTWISDKFPQFHIHSLHDYSLKKILNSNLFLKFHYEKNNLKGKCFAFEYKDNNKFRKIYSFATENISFIDKIILNNNNNKALTITGSGDQALMLSYYGFQSITCIDSNYLAKYYTELKIAAIKQLSFIDFTNFFKNNINSFSYNIFKKISSELSINCEKFWNLQYIKHNHNGYNIRNSEIFNLLNDSWEQKINNVPYLNQQKIYETIQNNIKKTEFIFVIDEFQNYEFNETYDLILLSNIADYSHYIFKDDYLTPYLKNKIVLDLGCGNGRHLQLINSISKFSLGLDQSLEQLKQSNIKTNMIVGNGSQLPFQNESFDCITSFWVWGTILDENKRLQVLNESKRVLKRNGSIFLIENDISSEFEYLRGRHLNNKTEEYNHWLIQHGFSILNKMETLITFDNLLIAQDVFQKIWQDRLFQLPQSQIVQHKVIIFELKVN